MLPLGESDTEVLPSWDLNRELNGLSSPTLVEGNSDISDPHVFAWSGLLWLQGSFSLLVSTSARLRIQARIHRATVWVPEALPLHCILLSGTLQLKFQPSALPQTPLSSLSSQQNSRLYFKNGSYKWRTKGHLQNRSDGGHTSLVSLFPGLNTFPSLVQYVKKLFHIFFQFF